MLVALVAAIAVLQTLSVTAGALISRALPDRAIAVGAGALFLGFAVWTWRGRHAGATVPPPPPRASSAPPPRSSWPSSATRPCSPPPAWPPTTAPSRLDRQLRRHGGQPRSSPSWSAAASPRGVRPSTLSHRRRRHLRRVGLVTLASARRRKASVLTPLQTDARIAVVYLHGCNSTDVPHRDGAARGGRHQHLTHAGAQAQRRPRAGRRQQDRAGRRTGRRRARRRGPPAGRHQDHQRAAGRRHHHRARRAVDPHRGVAHHRGAQLLPPGRPPAGHRHRQGGPQPGHRLASRSRSAVGARPRPGRRRHRRPGGRELPASSTTPSTPQADQRFEFFGLRTVYDRYLLRHPDDARTVIETPQYFFLRVAVRPERQPPTRPSALPR